MSAFRLFMRMDWTNYLSQIGEFPSILLLVYSDLLKFYPRKPEDETFIVCFRRKPSYVKSPIEVKGESHLKQ